MSRGFFSDLEQMRQENTQYAVFHINKTPELLTKYITLRDLHKNKKFNSDWGLQIANDWAEMHKDTFGDLFISELELVRWNKVIKLL